MPKSDFESATLIQSWCWNYEMSSRRKFIIEGLKQAGLLFGSALVVVLLIWFLLWSAFVWLHAENSRPVIDVLSGLGMVMIGFFVSILCGPVPTLLTFFDINDKQLLALSCVLFIPYWACLGTVSGIIQWNAYGVAAEQQLVFSKKQITKQIRWRIEVAAFILAAVFFLFGPIAGPNYISNGRDSAGWKAGGIINNLRQIDAAKYQFALEKKVSLDYIPTEADLTSYIRLQDGKLPHVGPERYVLNPIREAPYAVLDKDWRIRRHGWHEGYTITNRIYRLP